METQNNKEFDEMRQQMANLNNRINDKIVIDEAALRGLITKQLTKERRHIKRY